MLIQQPMPTSKYNIKCPYSMTAEGICIHNTANDAPAKNEISYMISNNNEVSFHVAVDDKEAIQAIPFNRNAWASGDGGSGNGNRKYIHFEICYSKSGGTKFTEAEKRCAKEVATLLKQNGWGIDRVKKHQDFSGKYCPHRTLDTGWSRFLDLIKAELNPSTSQPTGATPYRVRKSWSDAGSQKGAFNSLDNAIAECKKHSGYSVYDNSGKVMFSNGQSTPAPTPPPAPTPTPSCDKEIKRYGERGKCTITTPSGILFRNKPCTCHGAKQGTYYHKESVNYDLVVITERYVWVSWVSASTGQRRYMPITDKRTNERWANCV